MKTKFYIALLYFLPAIFITSGIFAKIGYPYTYDSWEEADPWGFYKRECVSYAAWATNDDNISFSSSMLGPNGEYASFGWAYTWADEADRVGFVVDTSPEVGAIAYWSAGHVAYVESVNQDNTVNISEYNYNYNHNYNVRNSLTANYYIHFNRVILEDRTIGNGDSLEYNAKTSINIKPNFYSVSGSNMHLSVGN